MKKRFFTTLLGFLYFFSFTTAQQTVGLFKYDSLGVEGYTLISPYASTNTYLINNCGHQVNQWSSSHPPGVNSYLNNEGDLIRSAAIPSRFTTAGGFGGLLERYDWNGELKWAYPMMSDSFSQHHDFKIMPNGNILVLIWERIDKDIAIANGRDPQMIEDSFIWAEAIYEIAPKANNGADIVWEWHVMDHLVQDKYPTKKNYGVIQEHPELIDFNSPLIYNFNDWLHFNSVDFNPSLDQIVISCHAYSEIYIIDHSTSVMESSGHFGGNRNKGGDILYRWGNPAAYNRGSALDRTAFKQHDAHWILSGHKDAGKILFFNNGTERKYSSVEIIAPPVNGITGQYILESGKPFEPSASEWSYQGANPSDFFSANMGGVQRLKTGNTLICASTRGRIFEINKDNEVVWEYVVPVNKYGPITQGAPITGNNIFRGYRYPTNHPAFANKVITDGAPIEKNHLFIFCDDTTSKTVEDTTSTFVFSLTEGGFNMYPNPTSDVINIYTSGEDNFNWTLSNTNGQLLMSGTTTKENTVHLEDLSSGFYVLHLTDPVTHHTFMARVLKQ